MNVDSPYFRGAVTLTVLWLIVGSFLAYSSYSTDHWQPPSAIHELSPSEVDRCGSEVVFVDDVLTDRVRSPQEQAACLGQAMKIARQEAVRSNAELRERVLTTFVGSAIIPAATLLVVVAFWTNIVRALRNVFGGYVRWLRFGSKATPPDAEIAVSSRTDEDSSTRSSTSTNETTS